MEYVKNICFGVYIYETPLPIWSYFFPTLSMCDKRGKETILRLSPPSSFSEEGEGEQEREQGQQWRI